MKIKIQIFFILMVKTLLFIGLTIAQTTNPTSPTSPKGTTKTEATVKGTQVPAHDRLQSKRDREQRIEVKVVAVKLDGNKLLGVRSLGEKKELEKGEIEAKAATDGKSMILAFEKQFTTKGSSEDIAIEKEIILDEETSTALGSNVFSILDGKYKIENEVNSKNASLRPIHDFLRTLFNPKPEHKIWRSFLKDSGMISSIVQLEVSNLQNGKDFPKSVLVTIKDGNLLNIKAANGVEKVANRDVYSAKASFVNTQLVLQFNRPLSRETKVELRTKGDVISDKETAETLGFCACKEGNSIVMNANTQNPTVTFPILGKVKHHRWLFHKTKYINTTVCTIGWGTKH